MTERNEELDGWKVRLLKAGCGEYPRYKAEARDDLWGQYREAYAENSGDALRKLAGLCDVDCEELLTTFGIQA